MRSITKNFTLEEFLVSETADRIGDRNEPTAAHLQNLITYTIPGWQIIRDLVQRSIVITSGYRNPRVNKAVGGVANSDHAQGFAGDGRAAGLTAIALAQIIAGAMRPGGALRTADGKPMVDQLILETSRKIVHVSFAPRRRGMILTQKGGPGTPFQSGLVS